MIPLSMTMSDLYPDFKVTIFFDIEYLGKRDENVLNALYRMVTFPVTLTDP